jgi:hypothetical protein
MSNNSFKRPEMSYLQESDNHKSSVLYVRGLENKELKITMIYNLFSNFGNIVKIIFIKNKSSALIEYENVEYATVAKDFLNNMSFFGNQMRIYFSNYHNINL